MLALARARTIARSKRPRWPSARGRPCGWKISTKGWPRRTRRSGSAPRRASVISPGRWRAPDHRLGSRDHGPHDEADAELARALAVSQEANDFDRRASALLIGTLRNWHGRYAEGLDVAAEGTRSRASIAWSFPLTRCLWTEGISRAGLGDYEARAGRTPRGLALAEKSGDEAYLARTLNTLGWLHIDCQDFASRLRALRARSLDRAREPRRHRARASRLHADQRGRQLHGAGRLRAGQRGARRGPPHRAPPTALALDDVALRDALLCQSRDLALARGDPSRAAGFADESLAIAVPTRSRKYESRAAAQGRGAPARRRWDDAEVALRERSRSPRRSASRARAGMSLAARGRLHHGRGQSDNAYRQYRAARDVVDRILSGLSEPGLRRGLETSSDIQEILAHSAPR